MASDHLPNYYSSLEPFRDFFANGVPILMYHKIGVRPRHTRLKGLYLTPRRLEEQLGELNQAGFSSARLADVAKARTPLKRAVVLTFDDGFRNVFDNALDILNRHQFKAIVYIVPNYLGKTNEWDARENEVTEPLMDAAQVQAWLAAGHEIGSHTLTHARLTRLSLRDAQEEISASKKRLEDLFNAPITHFCYPYGEWDERVRNLVMEEGYTTACTTEFGINTADTHLYGLKRITARYPSRSLRALARSLAELSDRMFNRKPLR